MTLQSKLYDVFASRTYEFEDFYRNFMYINIIRVPAAIIFMSTILQSTFFVSKVIAMQTAT